jgi:asparagine synthetase B (glutamine-hydrolysing)
MESYLAKEEYASGMWGIETRYPFLDKDVVQEFLWLDNNLKNKWYKSVLHNYLTKNNFPFNSEMKLGF